MARVAVVGLGRMGGAMASRLTDTGHSVSGYDPSPPACSRASAAGVSCAASPQEAAASAEVVLSSLPTPSVVRSLWLEGGLLASLHAGTVLVELSTIDPDTMTALAEAAPEGALVLDCPVSGGPTDARAGTLTLFLGGTDAAIEAALPVLDDLGTQSFRTGEVGTAKAVKLVNNLMSAANVAIAAEAFSLGTAYGIDARRLYEILAVSGGTSRQFVNRFARAAAGDFSPHAALNVLLKDLTLVQDFIRRQHGAGPITAIVREMYALAERAGFGEDDEVALLRLYDGWQRGAAPRR